MATMYPSERDERDWTEEDRRKSHDAEVARLTARAEAAEADRDRLRAVLVQIEQLPKLRGWDEAETITDWPSGFCSGESDYRKRVEAHIAAALAGREAQEG